jgi:hypothetical protein
MSSVQSMFSSFAGVFIAPVQCLRSPRPGKVYVDSGSIDIDQIDGQGDCGESKKSSNDALDQN